MRTGRLLTFLTATVALGSAQALEAAVRCESLSSLALPNTTVTLARPIPRGTLTLPGVATTAQPQSLLERLPAFCRVAATLKPTSDSEINIEVWLPVAHWNGKFHAIGNAGWAGQISTSAMIQPLPQGYATASTDIGHDSAGASFALGHPEKLTDYSYRAGHDMTITAKAIIAAYYCKAVGVRLKQSGSALHPLQEDCLSRRQQLDRRD